MTLKTKLPESSDNLEAIETLVTDHRPLLPRRALILGKLGQNLDLLPQNQGLGTEAQRSAGRVSPLLVPFCICPQDIGKLSVVTLRLADKTKVRLT